jgi:hypothetical protein
MFHLNLMLGLQPAPAWLNFEKRLVAIWGDENPCLLMVKKLEESVNAQFVPIA